MIGGIAALAGAITFVVLFALAGRRHIWWIAFGVTLVVWSVLAVLSVAIFSRAGVCSILQPADGPLLSDAELTARCDRPNIAVIAIFGGGYVALLVVAVQQWWWNRSGHPADDA